MSKIVTVITAGLSAAATRFTRGTLPQVGAHLYTCNVAIVVPYVTINVMSVVNVVYVIVHGSSMGGSMGHEGSMGGSMGHEGSMGAAWGSRVSFW